jgi:serine/threonine protein kinase
MPPDQDAHPPADVLRRFGLGKLTGESSTTILSHLEQCDTCREQVASLSGDGFLDRMRAAAGRSVTPMPDKPVGELPQQTFMTSGVPVIPGLPPELANHPQYEVVKELGRGGMGVVYLARNRQMDRLEVLKVMGRELLAHEGARQRFEREIRSAARLNHSNIVTAYSVLPLENLLVFAMEYVPGDDLAKVVKSRGPLPVANACYYAYQAALGLEHARDKGMVHRDIKPQNLILARERKKHTLKVLDFGLAKATSEKGGQYELTGEGKMLGTPQYVAPEQIDDAATADIRADIYSLGCTLYFLLSGKAPFAGNSLLAILHAHHQKEATALNETRPDVPEALAAVVRKMMAKDPAQRYQTPAEVAQVLVPFIKAVAPSAAPAQAGVGDSTDTYAWKSVAGPADPAPASRPAKGRRWMIGACVLAGVLLAGLVGLAASGVFRVKVGDAVIVEGDSKSKVGEIVTRDEFDAEKKRLDDEGGIAPRGTATEPPAGHGPAAAAAEAREVQPVVPLAGRRGRRGGRGGARGLQDGERDPGESRQEGRDPAPVETASESIFNGKDLTGWIKPDGSPATWNVEDGVLVVVPGQGNIMTAWDFGPDFTLHAEFNVPLQANRAGQARGNSGIFLLGLYEIQILDGWKNPQPQPPERDCGALYGQIGPSRNVCKPPNEWQTFDITFRAPRLDADKAVIQKGELSVVHNGVLVIDRGEFETPSGQALSRRPGNRGPIMLQDHGSAVRFRNLRIGPAPRPGADAGAAPAAREP